MFNKLNFCHVCLLGLLSCVGHDIFEGVLQLDFLLFFSYLAKYNCFDTTFINYRLKTLKLMHEDAASKPPLIPQRYFKLPGNASQNWCLYVIFHCWFFLK